MNRKVVAEGSGKPVSRQVKFHHEARVAIVLGEATGAPMLELIENGYGDWQLVRREFGYPSGCQVLAQGSIAGVDQVNPDAGRDALNRMGVGEVR